jgi:hypothetical protein
MIKYCPHFSSFNPVDYVALHDVEAWWLHLVHAHPGRRKAMDSLVIVISWKLRNELNARIFRSKGSTW